MLVRIMRLSRGGRFRSKLMIRLGYGSYSRFFKPKRTDFDWLSSDPEEVDKYVDDPLCGQPLTLSFYKDFFTGNLRVRKMKNLKQLPKNLPVLIFCGGKDPTGRFGKDIKLLQEEYSRIGINDVGIKIYPEGRHEMLNDVNREEVWSDILKWLETKLNSV